MPKKAVSFFKRLMKFDISVPGILGGTNISLEDVKAPKKNGRYRVLDWFIGIFIKQKESDNLLKITENPRRVGLITIFMFFGIFGTWAAFAPLDGATIAMGEIIAQSDKKIIQHLEGGIIKEILVKEGETVKEGQPLIYLNDINAKTQVGILNERQFTLLITEARLIAERDYTQEMQIPDDKDFYSITQEKRVKTIANQISIFKSRMGSVKNQISIINKKIEQTQNEVVALNSQLRSAQKQLDLVEEDLKNKKELLASGVIDKVKVNMLEREQANLSGRVGELGAHISRAEQKIAESDLEILNIKNRFNQEIVLELKEVSNMINENEEKLSAAKDVLNRAIITAPQSGRITGFKYHSIGGVIPSGATIMEITPDNENMVVEAKIMPNNIEAVITSEMRKENQVEIDGTKGIKSKVRLTAFSPRKVGLLDCVMTYVSADTIVDQKTGMQYYLAYIKIPNSEIAKINANIKLYPGMPAVVYITTESRTLLSYLLSPITSTFENAFRER